MVKQNSSSIAVENARQQRQSVGEHRPRTIESVMQDPANRPDQQPAPAEALFYGLVNESIEQLICEGFGRDKWHAVKAKAGLTDVEDGDFLQSQQYDQEVTYRIVGGITEVLGLTGEQALEAAGDNFVSKYLLRNGYLDLLRAQGSTLREFMGNMDTMHSYLKRETLPGLAPPSFKTEDAPDGVGFLLHYWSFRPGLGPLVQGMVGACGKILFEQEIKLEVLRSSEASGSHYVVFHVMVTPIAGTAAAFEVGGSVDNPPAVSLPASGPASGGLTLAQLCSPRVSVSATALSEESESVRSPGVVVRTPSAALLPVPEISTLSAQRGESRTMSSFNGMRSLFGMSSLRDTSFEESSVESGGGERKSGSMFGRSVNAFGWSKASFNRSTSGARSSHSGGDSANDGRSLQRAASEKQKLVHSSERNALVFMMTKAVGELRSGEDVLKFGERFSVDQLCSLLRVRGVTGAQALAGLFRAPLAAGGTLRPPHQAFLHRHMMAMEQPATTMHRGITNRHTDSRGNKCVDCCNPPLADQHIIHGLLGFKAAKALKKVRLRVCVFPHILSYKVLQTIATTRTSMMFETPECEAILMAVWGKVQFRYLFDCLLEVCLNAVLCVSTEKLRNGQRHVFGLVFFTGVLVKEASEELWSCYVHAANQRLSSFFSWARLGSWTRFCLSAGFCVMHARGAPVNSQRPVLAGVVIMQWFQMLYMCRAFALLGPKLLPIMNTLKAMGPFLIVLFFYVGAFLHAYWALSSRPLGEVFTIGYRLGVMGDFVIDSDMSGAILEDGEMDAWLLAWFFVCTTLLTLFMMNVVIGVLGESYDVEHDRSHVSFLRSRAGICAEYSSRMWKVQRPIKLYRVIGWALHRAQKSQWKCVASLLALAPVIACYGLLRVVFAEWHCYDYQGAYDGQDTAAPFLWVCESLEENEEARDSDHGRMQILTQRFEQSFEDFQKKQKKVTDALEEQRKQDKAKVESTLDLLMEKVTQMSEKLDNQRPAHPREMSIIPPLKGVPGGKGSIGKESETAKQNGHGNGVRGGGGGAFKCPFSGMSVDREVMLGRTPAPPPDNPSGPTGTTDITQWSPIARAQPARPDGLEAPEEQLIHGLINVAFEQLVMTRFGVGRWHEVKAKAGLEHVGDGEFVDGQQYDLDVTYRIVKGMVDVMLMTENEAMEAAGEYFVSTYLLKCGHLDLLRAQGSTLREFMGNMDTMHAYLKREVMKTIAPPSFKTEDAPDGVGFLLHYWSFRPGLGPLVQGMVGACGKILFEQEIKLEVLRSSEASGSHYVLFRVTEAGKDGAGQRGGKVEGAGRVGGGTEVVGGGEGGGQPARPDQQPAPAEALFYGLVNESIEQLICEGFGRDKWHAVKAKAGLTDVEDGDFLQSQQYDQEVTYRIVGGITEVLGLTGEQALEAAGDNFVSKYLLRNGYLDLLRAQGSTLREFMGNMDTMHSYLKRETLPGLAPPSFKTEDAPDGVGFLLHYWSFRPGLGPLVQGMVGACGKILFEQEIKLEVLRSSEASGSHYVLFRVTDVRL